MIFKWYKVLVVALAIVTRVRVERVEEGWPLPEGQGADGPRAVREHRLEHALDYSDQHLMELESRKELVSEEILQQDDVSEGEAAHELDISNDDDEVEDLAYDSDIERIYTKTDLEDVDTGKHTRHDNEASEPEPGPGSGPGRRSEFRRTQHWDDKPKCLIFRRGRENVDQKELSRDTRELVTREPSMYYDMKRAKRRMLAFPRHGTEDRSSWGAKILEALESALNTAAKKYGSNIAYNIDERESITQYPERRTFTEMPPARTSVTSRYEEPKRHTFLADHRLPSTNIEPEQPISSTSEISGEARTSTLRKQTLPYKDISSTEASSGQNDGKNLVDPHYKREKSSKTWSRSRDNSDDDAPEKQDGRMDVMPYSQESRKYVKVPQGRGQSFSSESEEVSVSAPKNILKGKTPIGKLLRTTTTLTLHRTKTYGTTEEVDSLIVDSDRTFSTADALDTSVEQHSPIKTTKRIKNFYPITYNSRQITSSYESKSNENYENSLEVADETPSSTSSPSPLLTKSVPNRNKEKYSETSHDSSQQLTSEEEDKEVDVDTSEESGLGLTHSNSSAPKSTAELGDITDSESSIQRSTVKSIEVSQQANYHVNHETFITLNTSRVPDQVSGGVPDQVSGRRYKEEFHSSIGTGAPNMAAGLGVMAYPELPAPVLVSGMEELFILPEASRPMRKHWDSFYKSVSKAMRHTVSLQLSIVLFFPIFFVT